MRISFFGAAGEVTGSCYLVETDKARVLVDFGVHQGTSESEARNHKFPPLTPGTLHAVVVTHAHNDHTGRLPLLNQHNFRAPIYATPATIKLADILLKDSADLQENDARRMTIRNARRGRPAVEPLYTQQDIDPILRLFKPVEYDATKEVAPGVTIRYTDAGHILGSASVEMTVYEAGVRKVVVFSGDLGPKNAPLLNDPMPPVSDGVVPDVVIMESTYGDRDHRPLSQSLEELAGALREAVWDKEKVLMPSFAVGRTQTFLHHLGELILSKTVPHFPIYLDSPMAIEATKLYEEFVRTFDAEARSQVLHGVDPLHLDLVTCTKSGDQSRQLNDARGAMAIIAGSGMCNGGRILHHLRHNIWKRDVRVIIAGYQAQGTLGRRLVEGADEVRIFGEFVVVRAKIHTIGGLSAHAGQAGLMEWAGAFCTKPKKPRFILTHGEDAPRHVLSRKLEAELGTGKVHCPQWGGWVEL